MKARNDREAVARTPATASVVRTLTDLLAIRSLSGEEAKIASTIRDRLEAFGLRVIADAEHNVFAVVGDGPETCHVNGHTDTIAPVTGWQRDPWTPAVEGERIYGLGASDMKAGLAVMIEVAGRLARQPPAVRTVFSFTVCEEMRPAGTTNGVETLLAGELGSATLAAGRWMISTEPGVVAEGSRTRALTLCVGCQGHVHVFVTCRGKPAHSSVPEHGANAVTVAAEVVRRVEQANADYQPVSVVREQYGRPSAAVTRIRGGEALNVIPAECTLHVSRRIAPGETLQTVHEEYETLLRGLDATFRLAGGTPAETSDPHGALLAAAEAAFDVAGLPRRYSFLRGRGDSVLFAERGMDCIGIGPGLCDQAHCPDEHCRARDLVNALDALEGTIRRLGPEGEPESAGPL